MFRLPLLSRVLTVLVLLGLLLAPAATVLADGSGATTFTQTFHNATQTFVGSTFCSGSLANITLTYNGVIHSTVNKAGDFWFTATMTGDVYAVTLDASPVTYTGHFTNWFGGAINNKNMVNDSTFSLHVTGSDGSSFMFHDVAHFSTNANGVVLSFDKPSCS